MAGAGDARRGGGSWAGIWWLRKRGLNFSLVALFALAVGVPIGYFAGEHVEAINPIGRIYINILLATVGPLILVAIVSSITSLGELAKLRSIGLRSIFWLLLSNAARRRARARPRASCSGPATASTASSAQLPTDTIQGQVQ